jgi:hypothetical protein
MSAVIDCDIWRDGGSISAVVTDDDRTLSFWLQTNDWDVPQEAGHLNLYLSEGMNPQLKQTIIELASTDEHKWFLYLLQVDTSKLNDTSLEIFHKFLNTLMLRHTNLN